MGNYYSWATPEYILNKMNMRQINKYINLANKRENKLHGKNKKEMTIDEFLEKNKGRKNIVKVKKGTIDGNR